MKFLIRSALASCSFLLAFNHSLSDARVVSDHRVDSLDCSKMNGKLEDAKDHLALSIRPDVFQEWHNLPNRNWSFRYGLYDLAACWSLSRFQRLYFFLREPGKTPTIRELSDQARAHEMYEDETGWKSFPLKRFWFLPDYSEPIWRDWERGVLENGWSGAPLARALKEDLEFYQIYRFHQLENIRYIRGPDSRTPAENRTTWSSIRELVARGRKPLIILRPDRYYQHVVLVKEIQMNPRGAILKVYDSNSPWMDKDVIWHQNEEMFTAFDVIDGMPVPNPKAYVGVFIVDEDENERLLESLVTHYRHVCTSQSP
jgi:hypothetical protein